MDHTQRHGEHARSTHTVESGDTADYIASAGTGADGLVRIELDGDGRLWDVVLDPQVTELTVDELRTALFDAITEAQAGMETEHRTAYEDAVADVNTAAERRFAEISAALHDLSRRAAGR
ncbi:DNA-binding protein YbaB [Actinoplanes campanulatus]|uniref:DNA-binding protein YbaB n=1 Tax=Actinoplanes campanulatus TaxID=113559 RepID=A0A7W5ALA8_9ACTN|nr:hypothetical protein [Actinoplanes campanulatus]MBB3098373.1 DNA-binding protein YbaB [Actinoplanes campanulatus]GGN34112.1 hypothetical protein GCM10010109_56800 [Actinoplanes campanulatus]GID38666.1 hypothetical protein Aca09nite_51720 [Actinoplanes campanulatus]